MATAAATSPSLKCQIPVSILVVRRGAGVLGAVAVDRNVERTTTIAPDPEEIAIAENYFFMLGTTNVDHVEKSFKRA